MRKRLSTIILILFFLAGLSLMLYPIISNYWNSLHQSGAIAGYTEAVANMNEEEYARILDEARTYNADLAAQGGLGALSTEQQARYESILDLSGDGVMGYVEIPSIRCTLPIYHGTSVDVLQVAVGHLDWSSLPVGGESTHCVLSGHRGLPSAKLFTDLDRVLEGDIFMLRTLDEVLTYEVDQILIVEPEEVDSLGITPGMDYCTLVTCTPYGINSHRLLVRGHRIANLEESEEIRVTAGAIPIEPLLVAPILAAPILLVLLILLLLPKRNPYRGNFDDFM